MSQQPYSPDTASQPGSAGGHPTQHDTTALPRVPLGEPGPAGGAPQGYPTGYGYAPGPPPINHEAAVWQERFGRQRTRTRIAVGFAALTSAIALVLGVATWQLANNSLFSSASDIAAGLGTGDQGLEGPLPGDPAPQDGQQQDGQSDSTGPGAGVPLSELPLPDSLKSLAAALGITDVGQLLDLAVANGMVSQVEADQLLAALAVGNAQGSGQ